MKVLTNLLKVDFKLILREFIVVFFSLIFSVLMILMFGSIYGNKPIPFFGGYGSVDVLVPTYLGVILSVNGIMSLPLTLVEYREKKILKRFMATPMKPSYIIISQLVVNFAITVIGFLLLLLVGKVVFDLKFYGNVFLFILAFVLSTLSIFSIGFVIASLVNNTRAANAIANIIYFPMIFLSGATFPIENFPKSLQNVAKALPLTYVSDLFKRIWLNSDLSWVKSGLSLKLDFVVISAVLVACIFVSIRKFKWYYD